MNDLSTLPERLRETAQRVREDLMADPGARLSNLLDLADLNRADAVLVADSIEPGAGKEYLR